MGENSQGSESNPPPYRSSTPTPTTPDERRVREILLEVHPRLVVSISSEVLPEYREYERTMTTCIDAYVKPVMERYIERAYLRPGFSGSKSQAIGPEEKAQHPKPATRNPKPTTHNAQRTTHNAEPHS